MTIEIKIAHTYNDRYASLQLIIDDDYTIGYNTALNGDELMEIVDILQEDIDKIKAFAKMAQANAY